MPGMPRMNKKSAKIAYNIIGVPSNMQQKKPKEQKKINERLVFEETQRVR